MVKSKRRINKLKLIHGHVGSRELLEFYEEKNGLVIKNIMTGEYIPFSTHCRTLEEALSFWGADSFDRYATLDRSYFSSLRKLV